MEADRPQRVKTRLETWSAAAVALLGGVVFVALVAPPILPHGRTHDFAALYTGGVLAATNPSQMYDVALQKKIQIELAPESTGYSPFIRPAYSAYFYVPLTWMAFKTAFIVWVLLGGLSAVAIWIWAARRFGPEALVYCAFFVPLIYGIINGQDTAFVAGATVMAYCAASRGAKTLCGVLLAVLLCKFHLFLLVPILLVWRREWKILAGFAPVALALVAMSCAIASPRSYIALLTSSSHEALNPTPQMMINAQAIAVNFGIDFSVVKALLALGVLATVLLIPKNAPFDRWFWAAVCGSMLISPHTFEYDAALLFVPILKTLSDSSAAFPLRAVAAIAVIPLPYFMTLLPMPLSAGPAIVMAILFIAFSWPEWFGARIAEVSEPQASGSLARIFSAE